MSSLRMKFSLQYSLLEDIGLVKLGILYGEDIYFSWCSSVAEKIAVFRSMDLVTYMDKDAKR